MIMTKLNLQIIRLLGERLPAPNERRIVLLTGARQTGKTTLARSKYPDLNYVNLDAPENQAFVRSVRTTAWAQAVGNAVLDEAQKAPVVFDKVKFNFDEGHIRFTLLLGSLQILLLKKIRETLAGRAFVYELFPLMLSEIVAGSRPPSKPLIAQLLESDDPPKLLESQPERRLPQQEEPALSGMAYMLDWGGMPALLAYTDEVRREWLRSYGYTYLERDLGDLARLNDLEPFRQLQRLAALRSGQLLSFSELARDGAISTATTRRYLRYLELSYQTFLLPPYRRNLTSSVVKAPKLYWMDIGILRQLQANWGMATGALFETFVVSEIYKYLRTTGLDVRPYFYRTRSGMEVDLLLETPRGFLGIEIKSAKQLGSRDWRGLRDLAGALGERWLAGLLVTAGLEMASLDRERRIWSMPAHRLLT
ncbi:MAG: ATP-binding protein [Calditrichaeota bacterium]|nr:MAG: ATP-binding protein [Calditrichota bacterium]